MSKKIDHLVAERDRLAAELRTNHAKTHALAKATGLPLLAGDMLRGDPFGFGLGRRRHGKRII